MMKNKNWLQELILVENVYTHMNSYLIEEKEIDGGNKLKRHLICKLFEKLVNEKKE